MISTHTPLTGCNGYWNKIRVDFPDFYSHTPHGVQQCKTERGLIDENFYSHTPHGVQQNAEICLLCTKGFLLTHPSRGATKSIIQYKYFFVISTHTPLTGCNNILYWKGWWRYISTHTPLTGCNTEDCLMVNENIDFYSHTPHGVQHSVSHPV